MGRRNRLGNGCASGWSSSSQHSSSLQSDTYLLKYYSCSRYVVPAVRRRPILSQADRPAGTSHTCHVLYCIKYRMHCVCAIYTSPARSNWATWMLLSKSVFLVALFWSFRSTSELVQSHFFTVQTGNWDISRGSNRLRYR